MDYTILPVNKTKSTILHRPKRKTITRFCQWNDKTKPSPLTRPTKQYKSQHPVVVGKYSFTTTISVHLVRSSVVMLCCAPAPTSGVIISLQWESPTSQPANCAQEAHTCRMHSHSHSMTPDRQACPIQLHGSSCSSVSTIMLGCGK